MSTAKELAEKNGFTLACGDGLRQVEGVYCCDLLSIVMGRAPADSAWVTVMGNLNSIAVAVLADVACIVLAENMPLDADAQARAEAENVTVLRTSLPVFEAAVKMAQ
ncbi:DRTGG domain-containing protein [Angelakisella massiliensis]|uniref:DRTGG domain-containing protein n=1 Tax=Angelakisella massiliensis TaxID=1871018 RepID=UPI0023A85266|nr:DRTGG domain-containing protein [Angelakisella massiliensis]